MTTGATRVTAQTAATQTAGTQTAAAPALRSRAGRPPGMLVCADGESFGGEWVGPATVASGEVVFNTAMSGYQEVLTDPSYAGQVVAFTYPHIGNYGVAARDAEGRRPWARAVVVRELAPRPSSWRSEHDLAGYLAAFGVGVLTGVDTRRLTRHIRAAGSLPCAVGPLDGPGAATPSQLLEAAQSEPGTEGVDLVSQVTTRSPYTLGEGRWSVVAYDFGIKSSILYQLARMASVEVVPASTPASEVLARRPDGVVLSNGPGDPAALPWAIRTTKELLGEVPLFGICLGHQLLATALGASTYKLPFGHHGGNHPVGRVGAWEPGGCADSGPGVGGVEVTSQNHNYAVTEEGLAEAIVTHRNLNDGVVEGISCPRQRAFSVQYHPEAGPGPHDARYLFGRFGQLMESCA